MRATSRAHNRVVSTSWAATTDPPKLTLAELHRCGRPELDDVTTPYEGHLVAKMFPDSRQYIARNAGHVASLYDGHSPPAKRIRRFLTRNTRG